MADITAKLLEEKIRRGIRAKRRFKAAVRDVIYNFYWIQDDNVLNNARQSIHNYHRMKKSQLSREEKSILRKDAKYRTEDEIKLLHKYIGGLKCFRLYPEDVRIELVKVTYFEYYGPKRTLIKEHQSGHALYFILSGEVLIFKLQLDVLTGKYVQVQVNTTTAGNMFGEISLLHNIPRTATVITSAPCELLVLKKEDFDRVLKVRLMQQWEEIRDAMLKFKYFDTWTAYSIKECCMLSALKRYKPNVVIYGDNHNKTKDNSDMIYFIVEGTCAVIEHLFVQETINNGKTLYKIYDPPELINVELPPTAPFSVVKQKLENVRSIKDDSSVSSLSKAEKNYASSKGQFSLKTGISESEYKARVSDDDVVINKISSTLRQSSQIVNTDEESTSLNILQKELNLNEEKHKKGPTIKLPSNVKLRFMQICTFKELATFFADKLMENRRVISLTPVTIMTIPMYWLTARSRGNCWSRIEEYLKMKLPSTQDVFKAYIKKQKWQEYKRNLRNSILSKRKFYNRTTIHDVPYSIRIMSSYDL